MSENKTQRTLAGVDDFLDTIEHPYPQSRRTEAK
jgi:hypothetical protein